MGFGYIDMRAIARTTAKVLPEAKLILLLLQAIIENREEEKIRSLIANRNINWERFRGFVIYHDLAPFIASVLKEHSHFLTGRLIKFLNISHQYYLLKHSAIKKEFVKIISIFNESKIPMVPIKGIAILSDVYKESDLRVIRDLDILVKKQDMRTIEEKLEGLGYMKDLFGFKERYWKQRNYHITFRSDRSKLLSIPLEIHWDIDYPSKSRQTSLYLWDRLREGKVGDSETKLLSPEDTIFILALHQRRFGKVLCLKYICDIALLLKKYSARLDWNYVLQKAHSERMRSALYFMLLQTKIFLKAHFPEEILMQLDISLWRKKAIYWFLERETFPRHFNFRIKRLYLITHFLLHDTLWEALRYFVSLPQEQFAKFFNLRPYSFITKLLHKGRLITMPLLYLLACLKWSSFLEDSGE